MKARTYKRFIAYLIDWMVVGAILMLLYYFIPESAKIAELNHNLTNINEQLLKHSITFNEYFQKFSKIQYLLDQERVLYTATNILVICIYFIIIPVLTYGKTLGLYIMSLKIDSKKNLSIPMLFIRNFIVNGLCYLVISFLFVYFLKNQVYFISITILGFIQIALALITIFMIIYRKDKRGLQDIFSKSKIIVDKEVKK